MDVSSESDSYADDGSELAENQHTGSASDDEELIEEDPSGPHHFSSSTSAHTDADRGVAVRQQLGWFLWKLLLSIVPFVSVLQVCGTRCWRPESSSKNHCRPVTCCRSQTNSIPS